jgi:cytoskeleton protein RodZ
MVWVMSDFGGKLRVARERRGISLQQIAAATKISIAALEALERNDLSRLPGGIFSRSFVRSYAVEVGLNPDDTVHQFLEEFHGAPSTAIPSPATASSEEEVFGNQQRIAGVVLKLVLITVPLIVLILYFAMRTRTPSPVSTVSAPQTQAAPILPKKGEAPSPSQPPPLPVPVATVGATREVAPGTMVLALHPTGNCWVRVVADGKVVLSRVMHAGDKETQEVRNRATIQVGDAGAFAFSVNDHPGKSLGPPGSVKTVTLTPDTLTRYLQ